MPEILPFANGDLNSYIISSQIKFWFWSCLNPSVVFSLKQYVSPNNWFQIAEFEIMKVTVCMCQNIYSLSNRVKKNRTGKKKMFQVIFCIGREMLTLSYIVMYIQLFSYYITALAFLLEKTNKIFTFLSFVSACSFFNNIISKSQFTFFA